MIKATLILWAAILGAGCAGSVLAEEYDLGAGVPDKEAIIRALENEDSELENAAVPPVRTRGISMEPVHKVIRTPRAPTENAVNIQIYFDYDSAELSDESRTQLAPLGQALASSKLQRLDFVIEGHTDGKGGVSYNQELSERRATAVKTFLVSQYGIDSGRINAVGKGKSSPFDPTHPNSAVNRRVRVVAHK